MPGTRKSPGTGRLGMAIPLVLGILFAIGILTTAMHFFSSQALNQSHQLSSGEVAYYLAEFGAREGFLWVRRSVDFLNSSNPETMSKAAEAPPSLKPFFEHFVKGERLVETETLDVPLAIPWADKTLLADYSPKPTLDVKISLKGQKPLMETVSIPGLRETPPERRGRFIVDARASYKGVERRVVAVFEVRSIQLTWPVIGRFVFMASGMEGNLNPVVARKVAAAQYLPCDIADLTVKPLVIKGGPGFPPAGKAGILQDVSGFLDRQGWTHLATPEGADPKQWTLGIAPSGLKSFGEGFSLTWGLVFWADIEKGKPFGFEARNPTNNEPLQYWKTHQTYSFLDGLYKETKEAGRENMLLNDPTSNTQNSCILRLSGTPDLICPTLVFGKVYRSYTVEQGLRRKASDTAPTPFTQCAPFPYVPEEGFSQLPWVPNYKTPFNTVIREACNNDWKIYRELMSFAQLSAYNEGLAFCLDSQGYGEGLRPRSPAFSAADIPKLGRGIAYVDRNPEKLLLDGKVDLYRNSAVVYSGELQQVLPNLPTLALTRCSREFASQDRLKEFLIQTLRGGNNPTGFYHVKGAFEWSNDWNKVALGGIGIVADGGVTIKSGVRPQAQNPGSIPDVCANTVSLVSLKGDLRIETGEEIIAALLAPEGRFIARGDCRIRGLVAVKAIDLTLLNNDSGKIIEYDPVHDWCDQQRWLAGFRVMVEQQPLLFVAKPK